jgi:glycine/D-amino acid oxidase-like deaminating enzyme
MRVAVVGGGIFGVTAALAMRRRGFEVRLYDSELPHPLAESTDISKVVRMDYGADEDYTNLGEQALAGWRRWNATWPQPLFHETGVTFLSRAPMQPGGFEYESYATLTRRGHALDRLDANTIANRFPAWRRGAYVDGYFNPQGGWAESGRVVAALAAEAQAAGVTWVRSRVSDLSQLRDHDLIIVASGSWVPLLLPELAPVLRAVGQPVFHVRPPDASSFDAARFPVFGADISRTGFYGFPVNRDGIVKIANHGIGITMAPGDERPAVTETSEAAFREMLRDTFPALIEAPIVSRRLCVYCDTADGNLWIARDPNRRNVVVATGGSGHAFKFAPMLGDLITAIALDEAHPLAHKFRWRPDAAVGGEAARHQADR